MPNILDVEMQRNDADAETVGEYLKKLFIKVWREEQEYNGKRPFGNSGWQHDVYVALANAGLIKADRTVYFAGTEDEYVDVDVDRDESDQADMMIVDAIADLFDRS